MPLIPWDDDIYSVHIAELDLQHQKIIQLVNDLHDGVMAHKGKEELDKIFDNLVENFRLHFITEEALMLSYGYPGLRDHKRQHDEFSAQILGLQKQLKTGQFAVGAQMRDFLRNWVIVHIRATDQQYSHFLRGKGLQ